MRRHTLLAAIASFLLFGAGCTGPAPVAGPVNVPEAGVPPSPAVNADRPSAPAPAPAPTAAAAQKPTPTAGPTVAAPLADALSRVTKKPFGLYVAPGDSPVTPERFRGYHTGVDFETTAAEQNTDVPVHAICDGPLALKKWATGYGGVAVQSCVIAGTKVTVVYGHVRLASVAARVGDALSAGTPFAVLGDGFSKETDGERKHLHLGIHKGAAVDIRGYVQKQADLAGWIDVRQYLSAQ